MGSPGIPARLRKIAALAERGSANAGPVALSPLAGSDVPGPVQGAEPDAELSAAFARAGSAPGDSEPEVTGHTAGDLALAPPPALGLTDKRRTARTVRPRRGRPRSEHADRMILLAATEVMADKGVSGLTIEEVASRAGVGKTTIYRRWSSRGTLALDAFLAEIDGHPAPRDTGTFSGDLRVALSAWVAAVAGTNAGVMLTGLIAEMHKDRGLAVAWQDQVVAPLRAQYSMMLDRAISRGEIPANTDAGVVLDLVFGACYYRLLHGSRPLTEQFVNQIVDIVVIGVGGYSNLAGKRRVRN
jgi:AcrR family transcriptional regulator